ncbi:hypothetical protein BBK82_34510 [Lentzea guizhouensis]|uniref:Uncharacterized protein n=2 Tax=Lentzea guizhouensis TaxID=1586287 RepID=A0A1B2HRN4_9PSEU|nr:hypothetical protein BBK82_34510 [Lentzea guizhouensis]
MDLMKKLSDVPSPSPEAYDRARGALQAAMTEPEATVVRPKRWFSWTKAGIATLGAAAVAAAVVMGTTGGDVPAAPAPAPEAAPQVVESPLVKLASELKAAPQTGDSSLVITTKPAPDGGKYVAYTVYTDKGQTYVGDSVQTLAACAARNDDQSGEHNAKSMAAARLAANGDVEKAKFEMTTVSGNALGLDMSPAEADKAWKEAYERNAEMFRKIGKEVPPFKPRPTGKDLENRINNHLWFNTTFTLFQAAANAEVRSGVLKLLAAMPDVTIGKSVVEGQQVLTLTADPAIVGGDGSQVLTINADNGLPISSEVVPNKDSATPSKPSIVTYQSSRVNLADVIAGKI